MSRLLPIGLVFAVGIGLGLLLGRGATDPELEARAQRWQDSAEAVARSLDSALAVAQRQEDRADSLEGVSREIRARAAAAEHRAAVHRGTADALRRQLAQATTPVDSLLACVAALDARESECAALRDANVDLHQSLALEVEAAAALRVRGDTLEAQVRRDSVLIADARSLVPDLLRAVRGCRVPLAGIRCPVAGLAYDATDGGLLAGADYPLTSWLSLGVRWRVVR